MAKTNTVEISIDLQKLQAKLAQLQEKTGQNVSGAKREGKSAYKSYNEQRKLIRMEQKQVAETLSSKGMSKEDARSLAEDVTRDRQGELADRYRSKFNDIYARTRSSQKQLREKQASVKPQKSAFELMQEAPAQATIQDTDVSSGKRDVKGDKKKSSLLSGKIGGVSLKRMAVYATIGNALRTGVSAVMDNAVTAVGSSWQLASQASSIAASERFGHSASSQNAQQKMSLVDQQMNTHWSGKIPVFGANMLAFRKHSMMQTPTIQKALLEASNVSSVLEAGAGAAGGLAGLAFDMGIERDIEAEKSISEYSMQKQAVILGAEQQARQGQEQRAKQISKDQGLWSNKSAQVMTMLDHIMKDILATNKSNAEKNDLMINALEAIKENTRGMN